MAVEARREARADAYDRRGHVPRGAKVALGEDGVHDGVGADGREVGAVFVHHHGDVAAARYLERLLRRMREPGGDVLDALAAAYYRPGKAHSAADGGRARHIGHDDAKAAAAQSYGDAGGDVARAADVYQHVISPFWMLPQSAGRSSSAASALAAPSPATSAWLR